MSLSRSRKLCLGLALGTAMIGLGGAPGQAASRPAVLVAPFDLFDTSVDQRPAIVAEQARWLHQAAARLRSKIDASGRARVIETPESRKLVAKIESEYAHPSSCTQCLLAVGHRLGVRYVFIGTLHKVSDLIVYMKGYVLSVRTGRQVMGETYEVKADTRAMLLRAADNMAGAIGRHIDHPGN